MVKALAVICSIFIIFAICAPEEAMSMDLTKFQWKNRLLFLFAPDGNYPLFKNLQNQLMAQKAEVEDRDLVVFEVLAQGPSRMNTTSLDRQQADSIRDHFGLPRNTFSLILVGKDGSTKLKRNDQVDIAAVFELIDSMPMRQSEMRQKNQ
jgi:hypothetical protein